MKKIIFILIFFVSFLFSFRLPEGKYELSEQDINYSLYVPPKLEDKMILVLHDVGEKGRKYVDYWYEQAKKSNYMILAPEAASPEGWTKDDEERIRRIIGVIGRDYGPFKILLNGVSESSYFAIYSIVAYPEMYKALCNFSGLVLNSLSPEIFDVSQSKVVSPFLFVHGVLDSEIPKKYARWDAQKFREKGYDVTYWEINKRAEVKQEIINWFEEVISQ